MKIVEKQDKIIVEHNGEFFILKELGNDRFRINDMQWNYGYIQDGQYGLMFFNNEIYWWYTEEGGLSIKSIDDLDNFADYLSKLLPRTEEYFYLITASLKRSKIVMLPKFLLDDYSSSLISIN